MKKILLALSLLFFGLSSSVLAQTTSTARRIVIFNGAPTGCGPGAVYYDSTTQLVNFCNNSGTWVTFSSGAGSGTVTSVGLVGTANQITVTGASPILSTGSWTLSIPTNPTLPGTTTGTFSGNLTGNVTGNVNGNLNGNVTGNASGSAATITGSLVLSNTPLTTNGDLFTVSGGVLARLATGTSTQVLHGANGWSAVSLVNDVTGNLPVTNLNSGTGADSSHFWRGDAAWGTAVTSVATSAPLGGGTITGAGTLNCTTCTTNASALTANLPVIGAGGQATAIGTRTGNTTQFASWTGATTAARCVDTDASGNLQITAADCGVGGGGTISGLTIGFLPKATSSTGLTANSAIDDSITTAATITSSEPITAPNFTVNGTCNTGTTGCITLTNGTAPTSFTANSFMLFAPTTITTGYGWKVPAAAATGFVRGDNSSGTVTLSQGEISGDCTTSASFAIICTKTNGSAFATSATTDTTNASNISSGTVVVARGGTGVGTLAAHGTLIGEGTSNVAVGSPGTTGQCWTSNGASADPTFQTCGTGTGVSSFSGDGNIITNSVSTGGVTTTIAGTSGGVPYFSSTSAWQSSGLLTNHGVLLGGGAAAAPTSTAAGATNAPLIGQGAAASPIFSTILYPTSLTSGGALYASSTTQISSGALLAANALVVGGGAGAAPATGSGDFTYATHTLTGGASAIFDMSAASTTAGLKIPAAAGAVPTADDFIATNTTNHTFTWGSNGTTMVGAIAATGTGTATDCGASSKVVTSISSLAIPGCTTLTNAFLPTVAIASGGTNATSAAAGTIPNATSGTASSWTATPTLGAAGTLGSVTFGNATSGLLTLEPTTGAITSYTIGLPAAQPSGSNTFLSCTPASTSVCTWAAGGGGGSAFPVTVSGTVNSGGIPCFTSTTNEASSAAIAAGVIIKGGGAGACIAASSITDNGTTVTSTDTGGYVAPTFTSNGAVAGFMDLPQGADAGTTAPCNVATSICEEAPTVVTSYKLIWPGAAATGIPLWTNAANVVTETIVNPLPVANGGTGIASGTSGGVLAFTASGTIASSAALTVNVLTKGGGAGVAPGNSSITDDAKNITTTEVISAGNKVFLNADFTDSTSGSLVPITGLGWTLPTSKAANYSFHCVLMYNQATAAVVDEFGVGVTGTAPTNLSAMSIVYTNATTSAAGNLQNLASTTPTLVVSFTPTVTTVWEATLDGTIEQPSNATPGVFSIYAFTTTGTDNLIVKRGSYCSLF